jgi:hypothetical protein
MLTSFLFYVKGECTHYELGLQVASTFFFFFFPLFFVSIWFSIVHPYFIIDKKEELLVNNINIMNMKRHLLSCFFNIHVSG